MIIVILHLVRKLNMNTNKREKNIFYICFLLETSFWKILLIIIMIPRELSEGISTDL